MQRIQGNAASRGERQKCHEAHLTSWKSWGVVSRSRSARSAPQLLGVCKIDARTWATSERLQNLEKDGKVPMAALKKRKKIERRCETNLTVSTDASLVSKSTRTARSSPALRSGRPVEPRGADANHHVIVASARGGAAAAPPGGGAARGAAPGAALRRRRNSSSTRRNRWTFYRCDTVEQCCKMRYKEHLLEKIDTLVSGRDAALHERGPAQHLDLRAAGG